MLNKFQFRLLKKLSIPSSSASTKSFPLFFHQRFPLQALNLSKPFPNYFFSNSQEKGHLHLLQGLTIWQKEKMGKFLDKYVQNKEDLNKLDSDEVKWILSDLSDLSRAHLRNKGGNSQAFECLSERDYIFRKIGVKDTIDVALNYYDMSSILIKQKRFEQAEKYLNEVDRIYKLLGEDQQAKSLIVQTWHLLAQIKSQSNQGQALELELAVLRNIGDLNESEVLPAILLSAHKEIAEIYRSRGDIDNMVESYTNALQTIIKYFGENSTVDLNFLGNALNNSALKDHSSTQSRVNMVLKAFPDPHERAGVICCLIGNIYFANKKYTQAIDSYNEAFKIFGKLPKDYFYLLYDIYFSMSEAQRYSNNDQASYFLKKAEGAIANVEQNLNVAAVYERWAKSCSDRVDPFGTEDYYTKALALYKTLDPSNRVKIFSIYQGWGQIIEGLYMGLPIDDEVCWDAAVRVWKEAEKYLDPTDHHAAQNLYINLEFLYYNLGNHEEGEKCLQKILQSCEVAGDTSYAFGCYYQTGESFEKKGNLREALVCYETAARVYEKDANKDSAKTKNLTVKISQIKEGLQGSTLRL